MASLPDSTVGSGDCVDEYSLLTQEASRIGTLMVRFSALVDHPLQRPIDPVWVLNLAERHFDNGNNVQKGAHPIMVMALNTGDVGVIEVPDQLPKPNPAAKFYLISGQHRVAAMKHIIKTRLIEEICHADVGDHQILKDEQAEWPAVVYRRGLSNCL